MISPSAGTISPALMITKSSLFNKFAEITVAVAFKSAILFAIKFSRAWRKEDACPRPLASATASA